jgi:SAM-dependent methyltransferase
MAEEPEYGNWVSKRLVYVPGLAGIMFLTLSLFLSVLAATSLVFLLVPAWMLLWIPAGLFLGVSVYFAHARRLFAPQGGNVQNQMLELVLANLDWNGEGRALDIGCGNGALAIKLARRYAKARVVGIDYWGGSWGYSKSACEVNARIESVDKRVTFQKASASALPFDDGYFDVVVSNFVFHEVKDASDKREVVREALRVVKRGGKFVFQDLFLFKRIYGDVEDLMRTIRGWGIREVRFVQTGESAFVPRSLRLPFMLGTAGIIVGER